MLPPPLSACLSLSLVAGDHTQARNLFVAIEKWPDRFNENVRDDNVNISAAKERKGQTEEKK